MAQGLEESEARIWIQIKAYCSLVKESFMAATRIKYTKTNNYFF